MLRRLLLTGFLLAAACRGGTPAAAPTDDPAARIDRVISGLRPGFRVQGEPPIRWTLAERMAHYQVPGLSLAVIDSGKIAWARGFGVTEMGGHDSVTTETLFQAGSISKPTFAVGLMRLVQEGKLDLDEDVNRLLVSWKVPENKFTAGEKVTLRRILSHNAGLTVHGFPGYEAGTPVPTVVQVLNGEKPANTAPVRVDTFPGAISRYSGGGTTIAMLVVTDLTKEPFPTFMQETVLGPVGMTHSTYEQPLPADWAQHAATGTYQDGSSVKGRFHTYPEMSAAGLWTTATDLAKLAVELQRTHAGRSDRVIDQATFRQMLTVQKAPFGIGYALDDSGPSLAFVHDGADEGFQALFIAYAERGQGFFAMANSDNGIALIDEIVGSVAEEYGWPTHHGTEKAAIAIDSARLAGLAGEYALQRGKQTVSATVTVEGGKLFFEVHLPGREKEELLADTDSTFFGKSNGMPVRFDRNAKGVVTGVTIAGSVTATKVK